MSSLALSAILAGARQTVHASRRLGRETAELTREEEIASVIAEAALNIVTLPQGSAARGRARHQLERAVRLWRCLPDPEGAL